MLRAAGLFPLTRLVEGDLSGTLCARRSADRALGSTTTWSARSWTGDGPRHTASISPGEMAVTLEDVALLFVLPCLGEPMGLLTPRHVAR
jgi:hypothetical protein